VKATSKIAAGSNNSQAFTAFHHACGFVPRGTVDEMSF
jgi:hypothetical protein